MGASEMARLLEQAQQHLQLQLQGDQTPLASMGTCGRVHTPTEYTQGWLSALAALSDLVYPQHPHGGLQPPATPVPRGSMSSYGLCEHCIYMVQTNTGKNKNLFSKQGFSM